MSENAQPVTGLVACRTEPVKAATNQDGGPVGHRFCDCEQYMELHHTSWLGNLLDDPLPVGQHAQGCTLFCSHP